MERVFLELEFGHLLVGNLDPCWIGIRVQGTLDLQTSFRGGGGDQINDDLVADQRLASPVLTDEGKQTVFDFVPLAGPWWKVTNRNFQAGLIRELLQFPLPQSYPCAIAGAGICRNQ